jgi:hypothetical protein
MNSDQEHGAERAKQVFDKELQIVRQRELLAKLEHNDGSAAALHRGPYCTRRAGTEPC